MLLFLLENYFERWLQSSWIGTERHTSTKSRLLFPSCSATEDSCPNRANTLCPTSTSDLRATHVSLNIAKGRRRLRRVKPAAVLLFFVWPLTYRQEEGLLKMVSGCNIKGLDPYPWELGGWPELAVICCLVKKHFGWRASCSLWCLNCGAAVKQSQTRWIVADWSFIYECDWGSAQVFFGVLGASLLRTCIDRRVYVQWLALSVQPGRNPYSGRSALTWLETGG